MLNLKNLFRNMEFIKLYRIHFFSTSAFRYDKQIEEKITKKAQSLPVIQRRTRFCCFDFSTTVTNGSYAFFELMSEFYFIKSRFDLIVQSSNPRSILLEPRSPSSSNFHRDRVLILQYLIHQATFLYSCRTQRIKVRL